MSFLRTRLLDKADTAGRVGPGRVQHAGFEAFVLQQALTGP